MVPVTARASSDDVAMVKEGFDSTVRPKVQTYEIDNGKLFLDAWAADGKPMLSKNFTGVMRVFGVISMTAAGVALVFSDWSSVSQGEDHVFTALQRGARSWWATFIQMDEADVAKARSVRRSAGSSSGGSSWSFFASSEAVKNLEAQAAAAASAAKR